MDMFNPPPPPGSNPGRYMYTDNSAALVWVEYYWWQRVPWFAVLAALIAGLKLWENLGRPWPK